jgi:streptomycin 6-kinase
MIAIPPEFAARTIAREGEAGRQWLARLPELVAELCAAWGLLPDGPSMHGGLGLAVPVRRSGEPLVLKVGWVDDSTAHEALALAAWGGRGAARLMAAHPEAGALLLERLDSARSLSDMAVDPAIEIAGRLLRRLAVPAPPGVPRQREVVARLVASIPERWERLGRPLERRLVDAAVGAARELDADASGLLVNWDLHYANVLAGRREPWLAIDPKVVAGEAEYGAAQLLWTRLDEMGGGSGLRRRFCALTRAAGLDAERARRWSFVRCIDYWLWGLGAGLTEDPQRCAAIVEWLT